MNYAMAKGHASFALGFTLSARWPGGEGAVKVADEAACSADHLTRPGALAPGSLPLPPKGRSGALIPSGR
jgi:hypothetical protein